MTRKVRHVIRERARALAYLSSASTIEAHLRGEFGRDAILPTREEIDAIRAKRKKPFGVKDCLLADIEALGCGHPVSRENIGLYSNGNVFCRTCEDEREAIAAERRAWHAAQNAKVERIKASGKQTLPAMYQPKKIVFRNDVVNLAAQVTGMSAEVITGPSRTYQAVATRAAIAKILHDTGMSYNRIAFVIGRKDHSSVIHLIKNYPGETRHKSYYDGVLFSLRLAMMGKAA